jgi:PAS domain-containing protein
MQFDPLLGLVIAVSSVASALAALLLAHAWVQRRKQAVARVFDADTQDPVFLFLDERLIDASDAGHALMRAAPGLRGHWAQLCAVLSPRFPEFSDRARRLAQEGTLCLSARDDPNLLLHGEWRNGVARFELRDTGLFERNEVVDRLALRAMEDELRALREIVQANPAPIWRRRCDGSVIWANRAYLALANPEDAAAGVLTWPLPRLFDDLETLPEDGTAPTRLRHATPDAAPRVFDLYRTALPDEDLFIALPADRAERAEMALAAFTQTLTKTFAHLPIGLVIFDRERRLHLFNPALMDLTALEVDFLAARPTLEGFLDRLRARQMIPEPKDYRSWRQKIARIETEAVAGLFEDVWSLPSGLTYKITGRPHPDGAVAFLFEDISAEVSLTRRFRAELETGQAVLDSFETALAVFSPSGELLMSNSAYTTLWGIDPDMHADQIGLKEAMRSWLARSHPNPVWPRLRQYVAGGGNRAPVETIVQMHDGRHLDCRLAPIAGGGTIITFRDPPRAALRSTHASAGPDGARNAAAG